MARYKMDNGIIADTEKATGRWRERREWDGCNHYGRSSKSQWHDQILYRSKKGNYYVENQSREDGISDSAEWVTPQEAASWLLVNDYNLPEGLAEFDEKLIE